MYVDDILNMIRNIEICEGLGLSLGTSIGSIVYGTLGYKWTIYVFGFLNLLAMMEAYILIPNELNKNDDTLIEKIVNEDGEEEVADSINLSLR